MTYGNPIACFWEIALSHSTDGGTRQEPKFRRTSCLITVETERFLVVKHIDCAALSIMMPGVLLALLFPVLGLAASLADLVQPEGVTITTGRDRPPRPTSVPRVGNYIKAAIRKEQVQITNNVTSSSNVTTATSLARRWGRLPLSLYEGGIVYLMDGNPGQTIEVVVDTASFELYVNPDCARAANPTFCASAGHYDAMDSGTSENMTTRFGVSFGTGGYAGTYFCDTLTLGDDYWPVTGQQFGVATASAYVWAGMIGLGYGEGYNTPYPTMLDRLVEDEYISQRVFSVGLGGEGSGKSDIIFGGVDYHKFEGWMEPVEIWPSPAKQMEQFGQVGYWVNLTSLGHTRPGQQATEQLTPSGFTQMMLIDTGSTFSYMDSDLVAALAQQFDATLDDQQGIYYVSCSYLDDGGSGYVHFGFSQGAVVIDVKYEDFVIDLGGRCALGVQPADVGAATWVLGDTFIRGAYVVFDQYYDAVWLANYRPCGEEAVADFGEDPGEQLWSEIYGGLRIGTQALVDQFQKLPKFV
ncbi:eukaryotic aspartyl protease protein [Apiospora rasikravindrae]|uniref:Eukaryotic aspartyl protease protein n=1 Tax=Apiospora rasikravindrae TaxID=990691 RepID=A0ABR1SXS5_9PEZI